MARHGATIVEAIFDTFINRPVASVVVCKAAAALINGSITAAGARAQAADGRR